MAVDVHETGASGSRGSIQLIDLTEEETEAPFAVREADGSLDAAPSRIPTKAETLAWLERHPVIVGVATGVVCFSIIAAAMSVVLGSESDSSTDDPVAGAAASETDGTQGSFASSGSSGANFTSDESKLSRTGAGKVSDEVDGRSDGEDSGTLDVDPDGPTALNPRPRSNLSGQIPNTDDDLMNRNPDSDTTGTDADGLAGSTGGAPTATTTPSTVNPRSSTTLNPGPNVGGGMPTTATTVPPVTNPTAVVTSPSSSVTNPPSTGATVSQTPSTPAPTSPSTNPTSPPPTDPPTTPTTAPPPSLSIAAPGSGSSHPIETATNFAADFVPGATEYCWSLTQGGATPISSCSSGTTYQLPGSPAGLVPGTVTVTATAKGPFGTVTNSISIVLYKANVLNNPTRDLTIGRNALRVGVIDIGGTNHCFRITQSGYSSGELCYVETGKTFNKNDPIWNSLSPGRLTVTATVYRGSTRIGFDSTSINLIEASAPGGGGGGGGGNKASSAN